MKINILAPVLSVIILLTSCARPQEAPVFRGVNNIEVTKVTGTEAYLKATAFFYNPNKVKMKLKKVDVDVEVDGEKIGTINHSIKMTIPANAEFKVPLDATFNMKQVGFMKSLMSILGGKKIKVRYKGSIRGSFHGFPVKVPIDYEDEVRI